ncbi:MAG TPA: hypothetical protein VF170_14615, partial [Planctomycetaceae bacterium]
AKEWLGHELPRWYKPCPIDVNVGQIGAGGATTFNFDRGQVFGWRMNVQGTPERILDSVIPHEVSHTVFASHFRRPLPRWADEGAATLAEHESEQRRQDLHLKQVWNSRKIPLKSLLAMKEYPSDIQDVMTLYAQGYSLADYLVQKRGRATYLKFLDDAEKRGWETALRKHYGIEGVEALEGTWGDWVLAGSPDLPREGTLLADGTPSDRPAATDEVIRAQSDDEAEADWSAPARPESLTQTASRDEDAFGGFLPPRPPETRTAATPAERPADGKEPRPAPLGGFSGREAASRRDAGATETSDRRPGDGRRALPRTSRVEPSASADPNFDFFGAASDETTGGPSRMLGMAAFPGAR